MGIGIKHTAAKSVVKNKFRLFDLKNNYSLVISARKGLKPELFYDLASIINMPEKELALLLNISTRTISNYKESRKFLNPVQSEHLLKLIAMYELGEEIFGSVEEFNQWLRKPSWGNNEKPVEWLITPGGISLVMDEIMRIAYGDTI